MLVCVARCRPIRPAIGGAMKEPVEVCDNALAGETAFSLVVYAPVGYRVVQVEEAEQAWNHNRLRIEECRCPAR